MMQKLAILALAIASLPATALAQRTTYDYRSREDVSKIRTFAFKDAEPSNRVSAKTTTYDSPRWMQVSAADNPPGPEPTIATSTALSAPIRHLW